MLPSAHTAHNNKNGQKNSRDSPCPISPSHLRNELGVDISEPVYPGPGLGSVPVPGLEAPLLTEAPPVTKAGPNMGPAYVTHRHPGGSSSGPAIKTKSK